jgi:hypothetical protein
LEQREQLADDCEHGFDSNPELKPLIDYKELLAKLLMTARVPETRRRSLSSLALKANAVIERQRSKLGRNELSLSENLAALRGPANFLRERDRSR